MARVGTLTTMDNAVQCCRLREKRGRINGSVESADCTGTALHWHCTGTAAEDVEVESD